MCLLCKLLLLCFGFLLCVCFIFLLLLDLFFFGLGMDFDWLFEEDWDLLCIIGFWFLLCVFFGCWIIYGILLWVKLFLLIFNRFGKDFFILVDGVKVLEICFLIFVGFLMIVFCLFLILEIKILLGFGFDVYEWMFVFFINFLVFCFELFFLRFMKLWLLEFFNECCFLIMFE